MSSNSWNTTEMNLDDPASPGSNQAPKKIEAYQCNLCPSVFGFKFNAKR